MRMLWKYGRFKKHCNSAESICFFFIIAKEFYSFFVLNLLISDFFFIVIMQSKKLTRHNTNIAQTPWINSVIYTPRNGRMITCLHEHHHENSTQEIDLALNLEKIWFPSKKSQFLVVFFFYICIKFLQRVVFSKKIQRYIQQYNYFHTLFF